MVLEAVQLHRRYTSCGDVHEDCLGVAAQHIEPQIVLNGFWEFVRGGHAFGLPEL